ncbi:shikimate dehydrogenase [Solemya pervernicosa gill symbiont]|uniref:Shikimate dehydrogenase (NADP(+)) n=2 Tax=Gammaproteobacteria incertae sedis TaxID=118884 RepID=A0A1T2L806_9GAMM|nr:shikimate dehydrogenase [Candidatus Reidiella endopervernicosa]OOZ41237.1 shikimate dehydrogenase [Solemya pervernicosa gill symbiont]QKQ25279.1 shikimate dehydrogenase [Candidatus Reidiella endopervernicosa]
MTDHYAVMGNPIAHSKSPRIHTLFAEQTEQALDYRAIRVDEGSFPQAVSEFRNEGGKGLNITVPFKLEAWQLATELSERARLANAVNTLLLRDDNTLLGDNTDGVGLLADLRDNYQIELKGARILVLGAGGAVRGVLAPLLSANPAAIVVANRTASRAIELAEGFAQLGTISGCGFDQIDERPFDLIINGTSASLQGDVPPIPASAIAKEGWCYDMMYGAEPTAFIQWATEQGATHCADGLGMLVEQAAESFLLWRGVKPATQPIIELLRHELSNS